MFSICSVVVLNKQQYLSHQFSSFFKVNVASGVFIIFRSEWLLPGFSRLVCLLVTVPCVSSLLALFLASSCTARADFLLTWLRAIVRWNAERLNVSVLCDMFNVLVSCDMFNVSVLCDMFNLLVLWDMFTISVLCDMFNVLCVCDLHCSVPDYYCTHVQLFILM